MHGRGFRGGRGCYGHSRGRGGYGHPQHGNGPQSGGPPRSHDSDDERGSTAPTSGGRVDSSQQLRGWFQQAHGGPYPKYKDLKGRGFFLDDENCEVKLFFDTIQADPYAPGSQVRVQVPNRFILSTLLGVSPEGLKNDASVNTSIDRIAMEDYLLRQFCTQLYPGFGQGRGGQPKGEGIDVLFPSQHILERTALVLRTSSADSGYFELRVIMSMPGQGRRIDGHGCIAIIQRLLRAVRGSVFPAAVDLDLLREHIFSAHDQHWLRSQLRPNGLVAFIANGAILPRAGGNSDAPMPKDRAVVFEAPRSMEMTFQLPRTRQTVKGMAIKTGVTLIAGGGFHGKSTLLRALEVGVYDHVVGDGREFVVCDPTAFKIRAEDRRSVQGVDISLFINNIPKGQSTEEFSTSDASGSTSQAANIMESLELGSKLLLIDEDTSATNFMIRDDMMKSLIAAEKEPITPFVERCVHPLLVEFGVSTILVVGGSGQFLGIADTIIAMDAFSPKDVTGRAKTIFGEQASAPMKHLVQECVGKKDNRPAIDEKDSLLYKSVAPRFVGVGSTFGPFRGGRVKVTAEGPSGDTLRVGEERVELNCVEQIVEKGQTTAIGLALAFLNDHVEMDAPSFIELCGESPQRSKGGKHPAGGCSESSTEFSDDVLRSLFLLPPGVGTPKETHGLLPQRGTSAASLPLRSLVSATELAMRTHSMDYLRQRSATYYGPPGFFTRPRAFEVAAALNRLRTLAVKRVPQSIVCRARR